MAHDISGNAIAVTGMGMISALGFDVQTCCAAARVGISRAREIEEITVFDELEGELLPVTGHGVAEIADGFEGGGRLVRLGAMALGDLFNGPLADQTNRLEEPLFIALPGGYYWIESHKRDLCAVKDLPFNPLEAILFENGKRRMEYGDRIVSRLAQSTDYIFVEDKSRVYYGEQAGMIFALSDAVAAINAGEMESCIIGGVDSLLDSRTINALFELDLLRTPLNSTGIFPGEAAAFVRIEKYSAAAANHKKVFALVDGISTHKTEEHRFSPSLPQCQALLDCLTRTYEACLPLKERPGKTIGNLNGDDWHAKEWSHAIVKAPSHLRDLDLTLPALSLGEVGAATAAVMLCTGIQALHRHYAQTNLLQAWVSADDGSKGSFLIRRAAPQIRI
jgi:hypothetical protein